MRPRPVLRFVPAAVLAAVLSGSALGATGDITLLGFRSLPGSVRITDVWGYHDAVAGREYAIVGDQSAGVFIVDVTDPATMPVVARVSGISGFDVKVWSHYVYACDGDATGTDSRIIDIADPKSPALSPVAFESAHNIAINGNGVMFLQLPGMRVYTLGDPLNPEFRYRAGKFGHDATPDGNRVYDFTGSAQAVVIWQVNNPSRPVQLGTISGAITYAHSGDASADGNYLYVCDELSVHPIADVSVWDISDVTTPVRVADIADPSATVHNLYIIDDLAFVAYYASGFKVFDVSDPSDPVLADAYDTSGYTGEGFNGAFGVYPYAPSGNVYVSDHPNGLYVFGVERDTSTPVAMTSIAADTDGGNGVRLSWEVYADEHFAGFRVHRRDDAGVTRALALLSVSQRRYHDSSVEPAHRYDYTVTALAADGREMASLSVSVTTPRAVARLLANYPNPFNPATTIPFELDAAGPVTLTIHDAAGARIATLIDTRLRAGRHHVGWDGTGAGGSRVASGTYFCRLDAGGRVFSRRVTLLK